MPLNQFHLFDAMPVVVFKKRLFCFSLHCFLVTFSVLLSYSWSRTVALYNYIHAAMHSQPLGAVSSHTQQQQKKTIGFAVFVNQKQKKTKTKSKGWRLKVAALAPHVRTCDTVMFCVYRETYGISWTWTWTSLHLNVDPRKWGTLNAIARIHCDHTIDKMNMSTSIYVGRTSLSRKSRPLLNHSMMKEKQHAHARPYALKCTLRIMR